MAFIVAILAVACTANADKTPAPAAKPDKAPAPVTPAPSDADARGRAVLKAQLAALANDDAFVATFAKQATVLTPVGSVEVHAPNANVAAKVAFLNPHAEVKSATFDHFASGGTAQVAWFAAELHVTITSHEPGTAASDEAHTVRAIELLEGDKVVVAAFTNVAKLNTFGTSSIKDPTDAGPLANMLLSPDALAAALDSAAVVFGTDPGERAIGSAEAKKLLGNWKKLEITLDPKSKVREIHTTTYGYAMTNVRIVTKPGGESFKVSAFVLAMPTTNGGWSVVGASYGALF